MVFRVYSAWVKEFDGEQVNMLNEKLGFAPNVPQKGITSDKIKLKQEVNVRSIYYRGVWYTIF